MVRIFAFFRSSIHYLAFYSYSLLFFGNKRNFFVSTQKMSKYFATNRSYLLRRKKKSSCQQKSQKSFKCFLPVLLLLVVYYVSKKNSFETAFIPYIYQTKGRYTGKKFNLEKLRSENSVANKNYCSAENTIKIDVTHERKQKKTQITTLFCWKDAYMSF